MAKVKVKVKAGSKGKPLGKVVAQYKLSEESKGKELYKSKAKLNVHINDGRQ